MAQAQRGGFADDETDRIAEAVMTLRNSGLFAVEPVEQLDDSFNLHLNTTDGNNVGQRCEMGTSSNPFSRNLNVDDGLSDTIPQPVTIASRAAPFIGKDESDQHYQMTPQYNESLGSNPFVDGVNMDDRRRGARLPYRGPSLCNPFITRPEVISTRQPIQSVLVPPPHASTPHAAAGQRTMDTYVLPDTNPFRIRNDDNIEQTIKSVQFEPQNITSAPHTAKPITTLGQRPMGMYGVPGHMVNRTYSEGTRPPRVSNFSGFPLKGETSFESWKFEVRCLMKNNVYDRDLLLQSVRQSLKGEAGRLAMHLGEDASLDDILHKLETVYGIVESGMTLLQKFYNAHQETQESVAEYGCRLEDILDKAVRRGAVSRQQVGEMLRSKLWSGLKDERMRNATRYKYETIMNFDMLMAELRAVEQEMKELDSLPSKSGKPQKAVLMECSNRTVDELTKRVQELEVQIKDQTVNNELLQKILGKIETLERVQGKKEAPAPPLNRSRPLPRDRQ